MDKLEQARLHINEIDQKMAELFEERMDEVVEVALYKKEHGKEVFDEAREAFLREKNMKYIKNEAYKDSYNTYFSNLMKVSKDYQKHLLNHQKVGYQGTFGAFGYLASHHQFPDYTLISHPSFLEVIQAVIQGDVQYGVVPFENSFTGEVGEVSDLLREHDVYISNIIDLKVDHNLLSVPNSKTSMIKKIYSHPQALSQCTTFLKGRDIELIPYPNTALAAEFVSKSNDPSMAAIASKETANLFNLTILEENIHSSLDNTTRFIVIEKEAHKDGNYFQLMFTTSNETGALARAINLIAEYDFNMESIKSRAIPEKPWTYYFHVEINGNYESKEAKVMLDKLKKLCKDVKFLGSYTK